MLKVSTHTVPRHTHAHARVMQEPLRLEGTGEAAMPHQQLSAPPAAPPDAAAAATAPGAHAAAGAPPAGSGPVAAHGFAAGGAHAASSGATGSSDGAAVYQGNTVGPPSFAAGVWGSSSAASCAAAAASWPTAPDARAPVDPVEAAAPQVAAQAAAQAAREQSFASHPPEPSGVPAGEPAGRPGGAAEPDAGWAPAATAARAAAQEEAEAIGVQPAAPQIKDTGAEVEAKVGAEVEAVPPGVMPTTPHMAAAASGVDVESFLADDREGAGLDPAVLVRLSDEQVWAVVCDVVCAVCGLCYGIAARPTAAGCRDVVSLVRAGVSALCEARRC